MQDQDELDDQEPEGSPEGAPDDRSGLERRLHLRAYKFWYNLLGGRLFPAISDMGHDGIGQFRPNAILLDFPPDSEIPVPRFIGDDIAADLEDAADLIGKPASDLPTGSIVNRLIPHYLEVIAHRAPVGFEAEYDNPRGLLTMYRGILLPFSDNNHDIHFILGVIGWCEVEKAEEPKRLPPDQASGRDVTERMAAVVEAGRAAAGAVHHVDSRSRESLYEALAHALGIYEESLIDRVSYERLLVDAELREQARAPFTPVVKLVFGVGYDKTRITEYATALSYAHRLGVSSVELKEFLLFHEGGIKGCVLQERRSRRAARGEALNSPGDNPDRVLGAAPSLAEITLPGIGNRPDDASFVLLLGRRSTGNGPEGDAKDGAKSDAKSDAGGEDTIDIIARIEEKPAQMEALKRRVATALEVDDDDERAS